MTGCRNALAAVLAWGLIALAAGCRHETPPDAAAGQAAPAAEAAPGAADAAPAPVPAARPPANIDRQQAETHLRLAEALESAGDLAGALADYRAALGYDDWLVGDDGELSAGTPYPGLARLCEGDGPPEVVAQACAESINLGRFPPQRLSGFLVRRGMANTELGDHARAMTDFKAAAALDSENPEVRLGRGRLYEAMGDDRAAQREYGLALLRRPDSVPVRLARGRLRTRLGDLPGAVADFDAVLTNPATVNADPNAYRDRAMAHCLGGQPEAAEVDWQVWTGLNPDGAGLTRELLEARGYPSGPAGPGSDPALMESLATWIAAGCPDQP
ncbi:MAG TPA: tetratricopeptide repeat protein [Thermohalobaculum sp.]|nr:tetratricopeptide repeat protein [Thermohalobaculum sp.]